MDHMDLNASSWPDLNDPLFFTCWRRQSCQGCLQGDVPCSWCAISSTCVPNPGSFPILAPLNSSDICPLGSKERWELRAVPFGCDVSTITFLTSLGSILGTLVFISLVTLVVSCLVKLGRCLRGRRNGTARVGDERRYVGWGIFPVFVDRSVSRRRPYPPEPDNEEGLYRDGDERSPLLGRTR